MLCIRYLYFFCISIIIISCGYKFDLNHCSNVVDGMNTAIICSYEPYSLLTKKIKEVLHENGMILYDCDSIEINKTIFSIYIISSSKQCNVVEVFRDNKYLEFQLILKVYVKVYFRCKDIYPINIKIVQNFFDNQSIPLSIDAKINILYQDMYKQAAQKLINKLTYIYLSNIK